MTTHYTSNRAFSNSSAYHYYGKLGCTLLNCKLLDYQILILADV